VTRGEIFPLLIGVFNFDDNKNHKHMVGFECKSLRIVF
jgi:hypothetical protein